MCLLSPVACFFRLKGQQLPEKLSRELGSKLRQLAQGWTKRGQLSLQRQVIQLKTLAPQAAADSRVRHLARLATLGRHLQGLAGVRAGGASLDAANGRLSVPPGMEVSREEHGGRGGRGRRGRVSPTNLPEKRPACCLISCPW